MAGLVTGDWSLAHDFAFHFGGAERVTAELGRALPHAEVHLIAGRRETIEEMGIAGRARVLAPAFVTEGNYRPLAPMHAIMCAMAKPIEGNLLASSYGFAHMLPAAGAVVVYSHSPLRQAWSGASSYSAAMPRGTAAAWKYFGAPIIRRVDRRAARRAYSFIATSRVVQSRIREYYGVDAAIIPPPIDPAFTAMGPEHGDRDHYLWVGRIVEPYKRLALLVEAFRELPGRELHIVGTGRDRQMIEAGAPPNVKFLGTMDTDSLADAYRSAAALILPSEDDFGMVAVEAISCGTPVIALGAGGALDTVTVGGSGLLYADNTAGGIVEVVREFEQVKWNYREVAAFGLMYTASVFQSRMADFLGSVRT